MTDEPPPQPGPVPSEAEEAVVTPVELDEQDQTSEQVTRVVIKDAAAAQALAAPRTPVTEPYDPAPVREEMRNWISKGVLLSAAAAGLGVILNGAFGGSNEPAVTTVFTGLVGLAGTIVGFYFGGKDKTG